MKLKAAIVLTLISLTSFAARTITTTSCAVQAFYVFLTNPSSVSQTVDIKFKATGGITLNTCSYCQGHLATICPSNVLCQNKSTYRVIPPGSSLVINVGLVPSPTDSGIDPLSGVSAEITVQEDSGYLTGYSTCQYLTSSNITVGMPLAGGRYF